MDSDTATNEPACPDCQVGVGARHEVGCDVARCLACGGQRLGCACSGRGRDVWTGEWPGKMECRDFGWYAYFAPNGSPSWRPCDADHPGATEDLNRLAVEGVWIRTGRRFVRRPYVLLIRKLTQVDKDLRLIAAVGDPVDLYNEVEAFNVKQLRIAGATWGEIGAGLALDATEAAARFESVAS